MCNGRANRGLILAAVPDVSAQDRELILETAREAMGYFGPEMHNGGLVRDSAAPGSPCSVAAAGFAAAAYCAADSLGIMTRDEARYRCLGVARTFRDLPLTPSYAGHRGFYYHFLLPGGPDRGRRAWRSELSTIDTALLVAGLLTAAAHFDGDEADEAEIRDAAKAVYERVDWPWMIRRGGRLCHGWRPEKVGRPDKHHGDDGFLRYDWTGYSEGLILYLLALGSPTRPVPPESYAAWLDGCREDWKTVYGVEYLHGPPLFVHQFPHAFCDLQGVRDDLCRERDFDYFDNAARAVAVQRAYADDNPHGFAGYGGDLWGISASNGPGTLHAKQVGVGGRVRRFGGYQERGVPPPGRVLDDGTLAPWAVAASWPFAPDAVSAGVRAHRETMLCRPGWTGFMGSYNVTYVADDCPHGWVDEHDLAIEQAPIVMMAANLLDGDGWRRSRGIYATGLRRAGFAGGWLDG